MAKPGNFPAKAWAMALGYASSVPVHWPRAEKTTAKSWPSIFPGAIIDNDWIFTNTLDSQPNIVFDDPEELGKKK